MKRKLSLFLVIALCLVLVMPSATVGADANSGDELSGVVRYAIAAGNEIRRELYQKSADSFMELHPNVTIEIEEFSGNNDQTQQKITAAIASGDAYDIMQVDTLWINDMHYRNMLIPIQDYEGAWETADMIYKTSRDMHIVEGNLYGFPFRTNSIELLWNKDMFREAGLDPDRAPATYDELMEYAIKLTKKDDAGNVEVYGFETGYFEDALWVAHVWGTLMWSLGGYYLNEDQTETVINSPEGVKALDYWKKLIYELKVSPIDRPADGFPTGKVAMIIGGEWSIYDYVDRFPDLDFGYATMPAGSLDKDPVVSLGGRSIVVPRGAKNPDAAVPFMLHIMSYEEQMRYVKGFAGMSGRIDIADDPWFEESDRNRMYKLANENLKYTRSRYAPNIDQFNDILKRAIERAVLSGEDSKTVLDEAAAEYNVILKQANAERGKS